MQTFKNIGSHVFSDDLLRAKVSPQTYQDFVERNPLSQKAKSEIANAITYWAVELGAVNSAHVFYPLRFTDGRAQPAYKLDGMIDLDYSDSASVKPILGKTMSTDGFFQNETDGSSFPSGGLRSTHRAAAFVSWDKGSNPFVRDNTLYIPSAFLSHEGDALDHKVPLLRSQEAINREGTRLLHLLGDTTAKSMHSNVGWEQEYFIVPNELFIKRPDLINCGRTLFGAMAPRNQEGCENYFKAPSTVVQAFMDEVQQELWKLGISLNVNHNEVAPSQHELSPIFCQTNTSTDQNMTALDVMDRIATKHGLKVLCHEKPYAGINGSGKHANWSLCSDAGNQVFKPQDGEDHQTYFLAFVSALTYGLANYGDLVRLSVSGAGNDHRLGAQEAPPAIISLYTGERMEEHIRKIIAGGPLAGYFAEGQTLDFGSANVEGVKVGIEDRNRTAPFPFCGNRFEFRAVGSSQNIAFPLACINTAVAEGCAKLSAKIESGMAIRDAVAEMFEENIHVIFNGNGYSDEWPIEAEKRGLLNLHDTPSAVATLTADKNKQLFASQGVLSEHEVEARQVVMFEEYNNQLIIEAETAVNMTVRHIVPALVEHMNTTAFSKNRATEAAERVDKAAHELHELIQTVESFTSSSEKAFFLARQVKPKMEELRVIVDEAERMTPVWPFPSYQQMLHHHHTALSMGPGSK